MVNFGVVYKKDMIQRWRKHYLDYEALRRAIYYEKEPRTISSFARSLSFLKPQPKSADVGSSVGGPSTELSSPLLEETSVLSTPAPSMSKSAFSPLASSPIGMGTLGGLGNESPFAESAKSLRTSIGQLQMADDHPFVGAFWKEIEKVETFYLRKSAELKGRLDVLLEQIHRMGLRAPKLASIEVESTDPFNINRDLQRRAAEVARTQGNTHGDSGESGGVSTPEHKHKRNPLPENHHHRNKHHHTNSLTQSLTLNSSVLDDSAITDAHELRVLGAHDSKEEAHDQFADSIVHDGDDDDDDDADIDDQHSRSIESIKIAFVDIYRQYCFLRDFCGLNYVAVIKIAKKYKKVSGNTRTEDWASLIHRCNFVKKPQLSHSIRSVEQSYASLFCHGSLINARRILLQKQRIASYNWGAYISGLRFGVTLMLMFWVIWDCLVDSFTRKAPSAVWMTTIFPIYRGCGCLVLLGWCWGLNVYVWDMNRVNWRYILELHPKFTSGADEIWKECTKVTFIYLANFLIFYKVLRGDFPDWIPVTYYPVMLYVYIVYLTLWKLRPWSKLNASWRSGFINTITAPVGKVNFLANYIGDVLTSLVKVIIDMSYGMCYVFDFSWLNKTSHIVHDTQGCADSHVFTRYITPVLLALPLWLRFMQCLKRYNDTQKRVPNLPNAGKYAMAHTVVIVGAFHINFSDMDGFGLLHIAWLTCFIISTLYSFSWDVFMDWGLGDREHGGLRAKLMFHHPWKYYVAIAVDFVLRFSWTLTLVPATSQYPFSHYIQTRLVNVMAAIEISRRTMWSWLRLENEQLHNTAGYRRVDFVPLHFDSNVKDTRSKKQIDHRRVFVEVLVFAAVVLSLAVIAFYTK